MKETIVEVCCGSYYDAVQASLGGADRVELNSALMLGGLTPTETTLRMVKESCPYPKVVAMVRPRGGGFCYMEEEFQVMQKECESLLRCGADGIVFGCLLADGTLDEEINRRLTEMIRDAGNEAVFHRAFDWELMEYTGIRQVHSSCKAWKTDPTTAGNGISYSMAEGDHRLCYDVVSLELVKELVERVRGKRVCGQD